MCSTSAAQGDSGPQRAGRQGFCHDEMTRACAFAFDFDFDSNSSFGFGFGFGFILGFGPAARMEPPRSGDWCNGGRKAACCLPSWDAPCVWVRPVVGGCGAH